MARRTEKLEPLTPDQERVRAKARAFYRHGAEAAPTKRHGHFALYAERFLRVVDRDDPFGSSVIPLKFNDGQLYYDRLINRIRQWNLRRCEKLREAGVNAPMSPFPIKTVALKARKVGISTYLQGRGFWRGEHEEHFSGLTMAHKAEAATNISQIIHRFHHSFPPEVTIDGITIPSVQYRVALKRLADDIVQWDPEHGAKIVVKTAGSKDGDSRSYTYHYAHISEAAHFASSDEVSAATAANTHFSEIHVESTANGQGNLFHTLFMNAISIEEAERRLERDEPMPENWNGYFQFFWAWWQDPAYQRPLLPGERTVLLATLSKREKELIEKFDLTPEQLAWRRDKVRGECSQQSELDPEEYFNQEYPSEPADAFVSQGGLFFRQHRVDEWRKAAEDPANEPEYFRLFRISPAHFERRATQIANADFFRWKKPREMANYIMGVDTAKGGKDGDWSVISIFDRTDGTALEEVARYRGHVEPKILAEIAFQLALEYNFAFIVPEAGYPGDATCARIWELGYTLVYQRKNELQVGEQGQPEAFFVGYWNGPQTRGPLLASAQMACIDGLIHVRHKQAIAEWGMFRKDPKTGKPDHPAGHYSDCVLADSLAVFGHFTVGVAPPMTVPEAKRMEEMKLVPEERIRASIWARIKKAKERAVRDAAFEEAMARGVGVDLS